MADAKRHYQPGKTTPAVPVTKPTAATTINVTNKKIIMTKQPLSTLFTKDNYRWMAIGAAVVILGMLLMMGGKNQNPNTFDYSVVYSARRITVAPILILAGLMIEIYAIFKNPKPTVVSNES